MTELQRQARALGDPTRHAIFRHVADAGRPVDVAELTSTFDLNHNAIRQHLAKLADAGLVTENTAEAVGPGRPRLLYQLHPAAEWRWGVTGPYERLSELLVEIIRTGLDPEEVGRRAATRFGVPSPAGDRVADIAAAMARHGFDPDVRDVPGGAEIVLRACPFASAARADRETICSLHLGIAEGLAAGSTIRVDELVAKDPRRADCRLRLALSAAPAGAAAAPEATLSLRGPTGRR